MGITSLGMAITPVLFSVCPNLYALAGANLITGLFTSGCITCIQSSLLESCPSENRMIYVGIHATLTNITLFISPFIGNFIHQNYSIYAALIACGFFRLIGSIAFFVIYKISNSREKNLTI